MKNREIVGKDPILDMWIDKLFKAKSTPQAFKDLLPKIENDKKKSIATLRPWSWIAEVTRGCNLRCGFCSARLFPRNEFNYMTMETWRQFIEIVSVVAPVCRLIIANAGEPTLNVKLPKFLQYAREKCPDLQMLIYTNGTTLLDGRVTYESLFEAGVNFIYVDMYHPLEQHVQLAKESNYAYAVYGDKSDLAKNVFSYKKDSSSKGIVLCPNPANWPKRRISSGRISNFFNNLDWSVAEKYGLKFVTEPPARRCDQPAKYPNICWDGAYTFCCFDFMREVAGTIGNVNEGVEGFFRYWFGKYMQDCRHKLDQKNRAAHDMCKRCAFNSGRGDIRVWHENLLNHYWNGKAWTELQ